MKCTHCNGEHPDGYKFCPVTGKEIVQSLKACTNVECADFDKHILPAEASFCPRCGQKLDVENLTQESGESIFKVNGVEFEMIFVEGGPFRMGSEDGIDAPDHNVTLSSYYIGKHEVTQELWETVMRSNSSSFKGSQKPVENVSWNDCQEFIRKLNDLTGKNFKLPTEAQWEYAARGGKKSKEYKYSGSNTIGNIAWYDDNSGNRTHDVGTKSPNELGIYDMNGNVWEWCSDWYGNYSCIPQTNPTGPSSGSMRVLRGGSWKVLGCLFRVSMRANSNPDYCENGIGFRLCL